MQMGGSLPGLDDCGVHLRSGGAQFCVWAPFAEAVAVTGDFNNWAVQGQPLQKGQDGCWYADVDGVEAGQEYKYLITREGKVLTRNDPRALQLTATEDSSVIVDPTFEWGDDDYQLPPLQKTIIYELHVGTFMRHDPALPGTFHDAMGKLDYLAELGVNVIEIMPCSAVWLDRWWGYTPDNIYAVDAAYGGRRAFMEFVKAAHQKGLGVILDVVYNHLSKDQALDLWQFDGWSKDGYGGIYFYNDERAHTPWGETRPDYGRPEVRKFITDNARMWLRDCHVDGLRVDATTFIRNFDETPWDHPEHDIPDGWKMLQEITTEARSARPNALLVAEDLQHNDWITKPTSDENGAGFVAQWEPSLSAILRDVLGQPIDESRDLEKLRFPLTHNTNGNAFERVIFSESHDTDAGANGGKRLDEWIDAGDADGLYARRRAALAAALLLTLPGVPMLFQGQEFQEIGAFTHYASLDWGKVDTDSGMVQLYRHLIALRKNQHNNTAGLAGQHIDVFQLDNTAKLLAYHRWDKAGAGDDVVVVANFANQLRETREVSFPAAGTWWVRLNTDWNGYGKDFTNVELKSVEAKADPDNAQHFVADITIAPYSVLIFSQDL